MVRPKLLKVERGIFQDPSSKNYIIRYWSNGKQLERSIGPFLENARLALNELKKEKSIGKLSGDGFETFKRIEQAKLKKQRLFDDASKDYLEERRDLKPSTLQAYGYILSHDLSDAFGDKAVNEITESDVRKFQARISSNPKDQKAKSNEKISVSRVNTVMQLLKSILRQEFRTGNIERDPTLAVKRKAVPKSNIDPLSQEELRLALSNLDNNYRPLFAFLANTGCRPNEAIALRWGDIDWRKKEANITKGRVRGAEGLPKTKSAIRKLPLNPPAIDALKVAQSKTIRSKDDSASSAACHYPIFPRFSVTQQLSL